MRRIWNYVSSFIGTRKAESSKARLGRRKSIRPNIERLESRLNPAKVLFDPLTADLTVEPASNDIVDLQGVSLVAAGDNIIKVGVGNNIIDLSDLNLRAIVQSWNISGVTYFPPTPLPAFLPAGSWIQLYLDNTTYNVDDLKVDYRFVQASTVSLNGLNSTEPLNISLQDGTKAGLGFNTFNLNGAVNITGSFTTDSAGVAPANQFVNRLKMGINGDGRLAAGGQIRFKSNQPFPSGGAAIDVTISSPVGFSFKAPTVSIDVQGNVGGFDKSNGRYYPLAVETTGGLDVKTSNDLVVLESVGTNNVLNSLDVGLATAFLSGKFSTTAANKISTNTVVNLYGPTQVVGSSGIAHLVLGGNQTLTAIEGYGASKLEFADKTLTLATIPTNPVSSATPANFAGTLIGAATGALIVGGTGEQVLSGPSGTDLQSPITVLSGATLTIDINGNASGTGAIEVRDGATLSLKKTDLPAGGITLVNAIKVGGAGIAANGAIRNEIGNNVLSGAITLTNNTVVSAQTNTRLTFNGVIAEAAGGPFGITFNATTIDEGTIVLTKANSYAGGSNIVRGTVELQNSQGAGTGNILIQSPGALALNGAAGNLDVANKISVAGQGPIVGGATKGAIQSLAGTNKLSGSISLTGATDIWTAAGLVFTVSGTISGANQLTVAGPGTLVFTADNAYTGKTVINTGSTLQLGDGSGKVGSVASAEINDNGLLVFNRTDAVAAPFKIGALISGSGAVQVKTGAVQYEIDNTYTGLTTLASGTFLNVGNTKTNGWILNGNTIVNGGTLAFQRSDDKDVSYLITDNGANAGKVIYRSGGNFSVLTGNTYTGGTTIETNTSVRLYSSSGAGTGAITVNAGGELRLDSSKNTPATGYTISNNLVLNGSGRGPGALRSLVGNNTLTGTVSLATATTYEVASGSTLTSTGVVSGTSINITGGGKLIHTGNNTYTGGTFLQRGDFELQSATAAGTGTIEVNTGNTVYLNVTGTNTVANSLKISGVGSGGNGALINVNGLNTLTGAVTLSGDTLLSSNNGKSLTIQGVVTDNGSLYSLTLQTLGLAGKTSTFTLDPQGNGNKNEYGGKTTVKEGTVLVLRQSQAAGRPSAQILIEDGATLTLENKVNVANPLTMGGAGVGGTGVLVNRANDNTYSGAITLTASSIIQVASGTVLTVSGVVTESSSAKPATVTLVGGGTLALTNDNLYTGDTLVDSSTLRLGDGTGIKGSVQSPNINLQTKTSNLEFNRTDPYGTPFAVNSLVIGAGNVQVKTGTVQFVKDNTYLGTTGVGAGSTLIVGNGAPTATSPNDGKSGTLGAGDVTLGGTSSTSFGSLEFRRSDSTTVTAAITGDYGRVWFRSGGIYFLTGANNWGNLSAATSPEATRITDNANVFVGDGLDAGKGAIASGFGPARGGTILVNGGSRLTFNVFNSPATTIINQKITGAGSLGFQGKGGYILTGATNDYTGGTTITNAGVLLTNASAAGTGDIQVLPVASASTMGGSIGLYSSLPITLSNNIFVGGKGFGDPDYPLGAIRNIGGNHTYAGKITLTDGEVWFNAELNTTMTIRQAIQETTKAAVRSMGRGEVLFLADNQYTGTTYINADSTIRLGDGSAGTKGLIPSGINDLVVIAAGVTNISNPGYLVFNRTETKAAPLDFCASISGGGNVWVKTGAVKFCGDSSAWTGELINDSDIFFESSTPVYLNFLISGAGTVTFKPTGEYILTRNNTYTGATTIEPSAVVVLGDCGAEGFISGDITNNGLLVFNRDNTVQVPQIISGTGSVIYQCSGTYEISGGNTYDGASSFSWSGVNYPANTGTVLRESATVKLKNSQAASIRKIIIEPNATLALDGASGMTMTNALDMGGMGVNGKGALQVLGFDNTWNSAIFLTSNSSIGFENSSSLTLPGKVYGPGFGLTVSGAGTLNLLEDNAYTGTTKIVSPVTVVLGNGGTTGSLSSSSIDIQGTLVFNRSDAYTPLPGSSTAFVVNNLLNGSGDIQVKTGAVQLVRNNSFNGTTTVDAGTYLLVGDNKAGAGIGLNGSLDGTIALNGGSLEYRRSNANTVAANITGSGLAANAVHFTSNGNYTLTGNKQWTGVTTIDGGTTVRVVGSISSGFAPSATAESIVNNGVLAFANKGTGLFVNQQIKGTGDVSYLAGSYTVTGPNTYTGSTTINSAQVILPNNTGVGNNTVNLEKDGVLTLSGGFDLANSIKVVPGSGNSATINSFSGNNSLSGTVSLISGTLITGATTDSGKLTFSNVISGSGSLTVNSPYAAGGTWLVNNATYTGVTTVNNGALLVLGEQGGSQGAISGTSGVTLNGSGTLRFNRTDSVDPGYVFGKEISGTGNVEVASGFVTFTNNNNYSGTTTIAPGSSLQIGNGGSLGRLGTGPTVDNGHLIFWLDVTPGSVTISSPISGNGDVNFKQKGTYILTGNNTYTGGTIIQPGATVQIGNCTPGANISGDIQVDGVLVFSTPGTLTLDGTFSGSGSVVYQCQGTYLVSGNNTYTGGTTVQGSATLVLQSNTGAGGGLITVVSGASLALQGGISVANPISVGGSGVAGKGAIQNLASDNTLSGSIALTSATTVFLTGGNTLKTSGVISGGFGLATSGSGTLLTTADNTYTGSTTIGSSTTLQLGNNTATGSVASGAIIDNGALVFNRTDAAATPYQLNALVSGSGTLKVKTGAVQLNQNNTYTGDTSINAGATLFVGNKTTSGALYDSVSTGNVINSGSLVFQRSDGSFATPLNINASISGTGTVSYQSLGVFSASFGNSYTGGTTIGANTGLVLANNTGAGSGDITVIPSGTLGLTSGITVANNMIGSGAGRPINSGLLRNLAGTNTVMGNITLGGNSTLYAEGGSILRLSGVIAESAIAQMTTAGTGRIELANANSFTGGLLVGAGTTMLGNNTSAGKGSVHVANGASMALNGSNLVVANPVTITGSGDGGVGALLNEAGNNTLTSIVTLAGNSQITVANAGETLTARAGIGQSSVSGLVVAGSGKLVLTDVGSYKGNTTVNSGAYLALAEYTDAGSVVHQGSLASLVVSLANNSYLQFNRSDSPAPGYIFTPVITGSGDVDVLSGYVTFVGNNTYSGTTTITPGSTLQIGNGGNDGRLGTGPTIDNGHLVFFLTPVTGSVVVPSSISGSGDVTFKPTGKYILTGNNSYTGGTVLETGAQVQVGDCSPGVVSTIGGPINLATGSVLTFSVNANPVALSQQISGAGGVVYQCQGTYLVTGNNSYSGGTTVQGSATVVLLGNNAAGTGSVNVVAGASLALDGTAAPLNIANSITMAGPGITRGDFRGALQNRAGNNTLIGSISLSGDAIIGLVGGTKLTTQGIISGGSSKLELVKLGAAAPNGRFLSLADNTYSGSTTIGSGTVLQLDDGTGSSGGWVLSSAIDNNGLLVYNRLDSKVVGAQISGSGHVTVLTGGVTLTNGNSYSGGTDVQSGATLILQASTAAGSGLIEVVSGGTLGLSGPITVGNAITVGGAGVSSGGAIQNLAGNNTLTGGITLSGDTRIRLDGGKTLTTAGVISGGTSALTIAGQGLLLSLADNLYTGATTISQNVTLQLGNGTSAAGWVSSGKIYDYGSLVYNRTDAKTVSALITSDAFMGTLEVRSGTINLTANNNYLGQTTIATGAELIVGDGAVTGWIYTQPAAANRILNDGRLVFQRVDGTLSSPLDVRSSISGLGTVTYRSGGVFLANGTNSYSGGTNVETGTTLIAKASNALGTGGAYFALPSTLVLDGSAGDIVLANPITGGSTGVGGAGWIRSVAGNNVLSGGVTLTDNTAIQVSSGTSLSVTGSVVDGVGTFGLSSTGAGTLILAGANTFEGGLKVLDGVTELRNSASAGTGQVNVSSGATLRLLGNGLRLDNQVQAYGSGYRGLGVIANTGGSNEILRSVTLAGNSVINTGSFADVLTLRDSVGQTLASGLVVDGVGRLVLGSDNSYTGGSTVNTGATLQVGTGGAKGWILGDVVNNGTLDFNLSSTRVFPSKLSGSGALLFRGNGNFTLTNNANSMAGGTTVQPSTTLMIGNGSGTGWLDSAITADGSLIFNRPASTTIGQLIHGAKTGSVTYRGGTEYTATANNDYAGSTIIESSNVLHFTNNQSAGLGTVTVQNGGSMVLDVGGMTISNPIMVSGFGAGGSGGAIQNPVGNNTLGGVITLQGLTGVSVAPGANLRVDGSIGGSSSSGLACSGNGTVTLTADNTYSGPTSVLGNTLLNIGLLGGKTGSLASSAINLGGTLNYQQNGTWTTGARWTGAGSLVVEGSDSTSLVITGDGSSFTGSALVNRGEIALGNGGPTGSIGSPTVQIAAPGRFRYNLSTTLGVNPQFAGPGGLFFDGTGSYSLDKSQNGFTGQTVVTAGAQLIVGVAGSLENSSLTKVYGKLSGNGKLGLVDGVGPFGLAPGQVGDGQLTLTNLDGDPAGKMTFVVSDNGYALQSTGIQLTGTSTTLNLNGSKLDLQIQGTVVSPGLILKLIDSSSTKPWNGATFAGLPQGATVNVGGQTANIDYSFGPDRNDVALVFASNLDYSLYTYSATNGTLDLRLGADTNLEVLGTAGGDYVFNISEAIPGTGPVTWLRDGGDPAASGTTQTSAHFVVSNLSALRITQLGGSATTNTVTFNGANLAFVPGAAGLTVDLDQGISTGVELRGTTVIGGDAEIISLLGGISQVNGSLTVDGDSVWQAIDDINLNTTMTNTFRGTVGLLTPDNARVTTNGNLRLGLVTVFSAMNLVTGGDLLQSTDLVNATQANLNAPGRITLGNADFGTLSVSLAGSLDVTDVNGLTLDTLTGLTGSVAVRSASGLTIASGSIATPNGGQLFQDPVGISAGNLYLDSKGKVTLVTPQVNSTGDLQVRGDGGIDLTATPRVRANSQTYMGTVNANILTVDSLGGLVEFEGPLNANNLIASSSNSSIFPISLLGGTSITAAMNFGNRGPVTLGDEASDIFQFQGGLTATNQASGNPVMLYGQFSTLNQPIVINQAEVQGGTVLNAGNSSIRLKDLALATLDGGNLTLMASKTTLAGNSLLESGRIVANGTNLTLGDSFGGTNSFEFVLNGLTGTSAKPLIETSSPPTLASVELFVSTAPTFVPQVGGRYTLVGDSNTTLKQTTEFANAPQGSFVTSNNGNYQFLINYMGGSGTIPNDIVLNSTRELPPIPDGAQKITEPFSLGAGTLTYSPGSGRVIIESVDGKEFRSFMPFPGYFGNLNLTTVDRSGDGIADSVAVMVAGGGAPSVLVVDAATGKVASSFYAFSSQFKGGGTLAAGMVKFDGQASPTSVIMIGAGPGAEPSVTVFDAYTLDDSALRAFYAYDVKYTGGVTVGMTSPDPTGNSLIVTASAINSHVVLFNINQPTLALASWYAFGPSTALQQMTVAGGDLLGNGVNKVIVGAATGWPASIAVFSVPDLVAGKIYAEKAFYAFAPSAPNFKTGVRVGVSDLNKDGKLDIIAGSGPGALGVLNGIDYGTLDYIYSQPIGTIEGVTVGSNYTKFIRE